MFQSSSSDKPFADRYRPRFHFTPPKNWLNDPNGLVHYGGRWHLFYQHNPFGTGWGHMHWAHAESDDLIRWRHLPIALTPDRLGTVFSGTVVPDDRNTSGLFVADGGGLAAVFTYFKWGLQRQGLAISRDGGLTWEKYHNNPIVRNPFLVHFRDPKIFYHTPSEYWIMLLTAGNRIRFYRSSNLRDWAATGDFGAGVGAHGGVWECPDLFELAVGGNEDNKKWVLVTSVQKGAPAGGSGTQYFIGDFDGRRFVADGRPGTVRWLDYGADNYAGITFANVPEADGRRIFIGWMSNWDYARKTPTGPWRGAMTVPRELALAEDGGDTVLLTRPVSELAGAATGGFRLDDQAIRADVTLTVPELATGAFEIAAEWEAGDTGFGITLANGRGQETVVDYDPGSGLLRLDRTRSGLTGFSRRFAGVHGAPVMPSRGRLSVRILVDACSVEVFAGDGRVVMTDLVFPTDPYDRITLFSRGGAARLISLSARRLDPR
jgi:fructan beta-fructosidase